MISITEVEYLYAMLGLLWISIPAKSAASDESNNNLTIDLPLDINTPLLYFYFAAHELW